RVSRRRSVAGDRSRVRVLAAGSALVCAIAAAVATAWPDVRDAALAVGLGAASQLALWALLPRARALPPMGLAALEGAIGVGSLAAALIASPWFALPAVTALATAVGLARLRRPAPTVAAAAPPAAEPATARTAMEELRA